MPHKEKKQKKTPPAAAELSKNTKIHTLLKYQGTKFLQQSPSVNKGLFPGHVQRE